MSVSPDASFPTSVRVGHFDYVIEQWTPRSAQAASRYGESSSVEQVIRVDTSQHPQRVRETLLHEILHAVFRSMGFDDVQNPSEEFIVGATAHVLTQVMVDNPDVRAWLFESWST